MAWEMMVTTVLDMASGKIVSQSAPESASSDREQGIAQTQLQMISLHPQTTFDQHRLPPELADISAEDFVNHQE